MGKIVKKNRRKRNLVLLIVIVLFLMLGFGYSFLTSNLNIQGSLDVSALPTLKATSSSDITAFRSTTYRDSIKTITLGTTITEPAGTIESWDVSAKQDGRVMAYIVTNPDDATKYDLYIYGDGALYANADSKYAFSYFNSLVTIHKYGKYVFFLF